MRRGEVLDAPGDAPEEADRAPVVGVLDEALGQQVGVEEVEARPQGTQRGGALFFLLLILLERQEGLVERGVRRRVLPRRLLLRSVEVRGLGGLAVVPCFFVGV